MRQQPKIRNSIRELRQHWGLTQQKFAAQLGVRFPTVYCGENHQGVLCPLAMENVEGILRSAALVPSVPLFYSPSVTLWEISFSRLSKYFPEEEPRL